MGISACQGYSDTLRGDRADGAHATPPGFPGILTGMTLFLLVVLVGAPRATMAGEGVLDESGGMASRWIGDPQATALAPTFDTPGAALSLWQQHVAARTVAESRQALGPFPGFAAICPPVTCNSGSPGAEWVKVEALTDRALAMTVYDPVRDRMIVIGGRNMVSFDLDAWALSLSGEQAWTHLATLGLDGLSGAAVYDPIDDRVIAYLSDYQGIGGLWELRLSPDPQWSELSPAGSGPSWYYDSNVPAAVYDPVRHRMLTIGGSDPLGQPEMGVWALSLTDTPTWSLIEPAGPTLPPGRNGCAAVYDSAHDQLVIFGGSTPDSELADMWTLSLGADPAWAEVGPGSARPSARGWASCAAAPSGSGMFLFGGYSRGQRPFGDLWYLDLSDSLRWVSVGAADTPPAPRYGGAAIVAPVTGDLFVVGGLDGSWFLNDTWVLSSGEIPTWRRIRPARAAPPSRVGHSAVYDPVRRRMIVFGGYGAAGILKDSWALELDGEREWKPLDTTGTVMPLADHAAVYDPVRDRMIVTGGVAFRSFTPQAAIYALSLSGSPVWAMLNNDLPERISGHASVYDPLRDRIIVQGGSRLDGTIGGTWALSGDDLSAEAYLASEAPGPGLAQHVLIYDPIGDQIVANGGGHAWSLSMAAGLQWVESTDLYVPMIRHVGVYDERRRRIVLHGTENPGYGVYTVAYCLPGAEDCELFSPFPFSKGGFDEAAIYDPLHDLVLLFGGTNGGWANNQTWALRISAPQAVDLLEFWAERRGQQVVVHWAISKPRTPVSFHVWRRESGKDRERVSRMALSGLDVHEFVDPEPPAGQADYWLQEVSPDGADNWHGPVHLEAGALPVLLSMAQNRPNPFNPHTSISYSLPKPGRVTITVYDVRGAHVATLVNAELSAGEQIVEWHGVDDRGIPVPSGIYFAQLDTDQGIRTVKVTLAR